MPNLRTTHEEEGNSPASNYGNGNACSDLELGDGKCSFIE